MLRSYRYATTIGSGRGGSQHLLPEELTDGHQHGGEGARASGQEFWRERQTKGEETTVAACMWGVNKGRRTGRRRFKECSDRSWQSSECILRQTWWGQREKVKMKEDKGSAASMKINVHTSPEKHNDVIKLSVLIPEEELSTQKTWQKAKIKWNMQIHPVKQIDIKSNQ